MRENIRDNIIETVERLEELLERMPDPVAKKTRIQIEELRKLLLEQRAPRLAMIGRRGSGKSSLINAIFGAQVAEVGHEKSQTGRGHWWPYKGELGELEILDTRGLQEGSTPDQADTATDPKASILHEIHQKTPDALLFLVKAKEVDAAIDGDLQILAEIVDIIKKDKKIKTPIVAILTHCDELEPKNVRLHDPENEHAEDLREKQERVRNLEKILAAKIAEYPGLKDQLVTTIGVSAYQSWRNDGTLRADERWRIEELLDFLARELPSEAQVLLARLSRVQLLQESIAGKLTHSVATICSSIALIPIPVADIIPITSLQVALVSGIGYLAGRQLTTKTATEFMAAAGLNVGASFAFRETARALSKIFLPGAGSLLSSGVAYAATYGIGRTATAYFIRNADIKDLPKIMERERRAARKAADDQ